MAFDKQNLLPLYQLEMGEAGESCAFHIAKRLGMPEHVLKNAEKAAYSVSDNSNRANIDSNQFLKSSNTPDTHSSPRIVHDTVKKSVAARALRFNIGDTVIIYPQKKIGIVYAKANDMGEVGVQIYTTRKLIPYKNIKLHMPAKDSYPENYDFSLVFEEVKDHKVQRLIDKHKKLEEDKNKNR
jgi:hypothetical protein